MGSIAQRVRLVPGDDATELTRALRPHADVFDDIERFYNPARRHSTWAYISPVEFENRAQSAQDGVHQTGSRPALFDVEGLGIVSAGPQAADPS